MERNKTANELTREYENKYLKLAKAFNRAYGGKPQTPEGIKAYAEALWYKGMYRLWSDIDYIIERGQPIASDGFLDDDQIAGEFYDPEQ